MTWFDLFTSSHCSTHLSTCTEFEKYKYRKAKTNTERQRQTQKAKTNTERQIQIQNGKDKYTITTVHKAQRGPELVAFLSRLPSHSVPASHNLHNQCKWWKLMRKKHSNGFENESVWLLGTLKLPHNVLRHSSVWSNWREPASLGNLLSWGTFIS